MKRIILGLTLLGIGVGWLLYHSTEVRADRRLDGRGAEAYPTPVGPTIKLTATDSSATLGYSTGTITVAENDSTIVGSGTSWQTEETANRIGLGMALVVGGRYDKPLIITDITDETHIEVSGYAPAEWAGSGLSYAICLAPDVDYVVNSNGNCFFLVGTSSVAAIDGVSQYLGMNDSWLITPYSNKLYVAVIPSGGSGTVILRITPCE